MADQEYKNYDSNDRFKQCGVRLTKDAEVRDGANGKMVRLTFVSTSRNKGKNGIDDLWVEANVNDFQAEAASFLKEKDVLHEVDGKPYLRRFGENNERIAFCLERAQLVIPLELFAKLKDRGFKPGQKSDAKPAGKKSGRKTEKRDIQDLPED